MCLCACVWCVWKAKQYETLTSYATAFKQTCSSIECCHWSAPGCNGLCLCDEFRSVLQVSHQQHQANEYYLFHGVSHSIVDTILEVGFDERVSNLAGLFESCCIASESLILLGFPHTPHTRT